MKEKMKSALYGAIIGDALGVPYEFIPREERDIDPCTGMTGYGSHYMPIGSWSDDTSLLLATHNALRNHGINYDKIMENYARWYCLSDFTPYGFTWGVGFTTGDAIERYLKGTEPLMCGGAGERDNGNGSLMRILPILPYIKDLNIDERMTIAHNVSMLTHAHPRSLICCGTYIQISMEIINHPNWTIEKQINNGLLKSQDYYNAIGNEQFKKELEHFNRLFYENLKNIPSDEIKSGGYCINTLEASLWCLLNNSSYMDTILEAVNLGYDTDTTACVTGGLAGLHYGYDDVPEEWITALAKKDYIDTIIR